MVECKYYINASKIIDYHKLRFGKHSSTVCVDTNNTNDCTGSIELWLGRNWVYIPDTALKLSNLVERCNQQDPKANISRIPRKSNGRPRASINHRTSLFQRQDTKYIHKPTLISDPITLQHCNWNGYVRPTLAWFIQLLF
jgi:hypothetical protein